MLDLVVNNVIPEAYHHPENRKKNHGYKRTSNKRMDQRATSDHREQKPFHQWKGTLEL